MVDLVRKPSSSTTPGELSSGTQTIPGLKYFLNGIQIPAGSVSAPSIQFFDDNDGTGTGFYRTAANSLGIASNGANIGTLSSTGLNITGAIVATGDVTAFSDARLKENVQQIDTPFLIANKILGVFYTRKSDGQRRIGVIAQQLREVLPECVNEDAETGMLSVNYGAITALLLACVQELHAEVSILRDK